MNITENMNGTVDAIACAAGVKRTSIKIEFSVTDDEDELPWTVRVCMRNEKRKHPRFSDAYGYGATIDGAADEAIADIAKHEAIGFVRSEPTT